MGASYLGSDIEKKGVDSFPAISSSWEGIPEWKLEKYSKDNVAGTAAVQPDPKVTYQQALAKVNGTPTMLYAATMPLNEINLVSQDLWYIAYNINVIFEGQESMQAKHVLNAWVVDPPLFGSHHDTPVFFGLAMGMLVSNRLGLLSFANLPLVFLYSGRNNFLLWATDWSHPAFPWLHRWIAATATLPAILHSITYLDVYVKDGTHSSESQEPYWCWGVVATVSLAVLLSASVTPIRRKVYELFLACRVAIATLVVAGCYWHIVFVFGHKWGYAVWIFVCMAVWGFDRVSRVVRLARHSVKTAFVTVIYGEYYRVTIPGVFASGIAYLYFTTLTWRVWDNYPFSVASAILPSKRQQVQHTAKSSDDIEKRLTTVTAAGCNSSLADGRHSSTSHSTREQPQLGITFYIRMQSGTTSLLRHCSSVPVFLDEGYPSHSPLSESPYSSPTLIALAGGIGITAVLPHLRSHPGHVKLHWDCRTRALVDDVETAGVLSGTENELFIGKRMTVRKVLQSELVGGQGEVCVLVSGPEGLIEETRCIFGDVMSKKKAIRARSVWVVAREVKRIY
ncbi:ferric reductase transmembrane component 4 [Colletotrichum incanum]|uniref:Ferric reductase transmembrane component 4 n=1 Tax=Colletotrichum incanum TaxID=1573173 RepID=A0A167A8R5_COLIC|nr:ferric reductase transmembrane component 4 [Colletotrichum incanum]